VIVVVGITDEVDRAAGLAEQGQPNNSAVDICPDRCFGECLRKSALAFCSRAPRTRIHSHFHRYVTSLRLADLVLATDRDCEDVVGGDSALKMRASVPVPHGVGVSTACALSRTASCPDHQRGGHERLSGHSIAAARLVVCHNLTMRSRVRNVALIYDARTVYDVKVMTGVAAYLQEGANWSVYIEESALKDQRLPDLRSWQGDGIIANFDDPNVANAVVGSRLPAVAYGSDLGLFKWAPRVPVFVTNNAAIARMGADYLRARGFVRFAYCGCPRMPMTIWSDERAEAFGGRVKEFGFPCWIYRGRHRTLRRYIPFRDSLASWLKRLPKPIGVMAANDARARQVLEVCRLAGVRVPEDVAVLGVDNDEMVCQLSSPLLSSIEQGARQIGYATAGLLDRMMQGRRGPRPRCCTIDPVGIVERSSTDVLGTEDPALRAAMAFIAERVCDGIKAREVVKAVGLPRHWLEAAFRKTLGRSLYSHILHVRLERTKTLLSKTGLPLKQVAAGAGFRSVQHMSTLFRKAFGNAPAAYRRVLTGK